MLESMIEAFEDTLDNAFPESALIGLDDARRLTGPGLLWNCQGAVLDVSYTEFSSKQIHRVWQVQARRVLNALGWQDEQITDRAFEGGSSLAISAPMDQLYSAVAVAQTAWLLSASELLNQPVEGFDVLIARLKAILQQEANPKLLTLLAAANQHHVDALCDDEVVSVGYGQASQCWPVGNLPAPEALDWSKLHDLPVGLITGTNGKTTSTRLCFAIARAAGLTAGLTSTDFVRVGDDILDYGDYSGPGGARMLLRDPRLQIAYLEVARGGILRRGLPLRRARAALVTNVAADHLGQYGVNSVAQLAAAKFSVYRALKEDGVLILNADDDYVAAEALNTPARIWWFSMHLHSSLIQASIANATPCAWAEKNTLVFFDGKEQQPIIKINEIPITMAGAARYNILNALGAVCLSRAMGLDNAAIHAGLSGFQNNPRDNPGRCNEFSLNGARVFVDFAHNPHSIDAVVKAISAIPAKRRFLLLSHAGDRSDQDIHDVTVSALRLEPGCLVAAELPDYLRGREQGDIPRRITEASLANGLNAAQIIQAGSPSCGVAMILERVQPGDVALLLVLSERDEIFTMLES
jgi:UDP-N-acetylmuramyl tripeptide synthase